MSLTPALFTSPKADGTDPTKLRPSNWNRIVSLIKQPARRRRRRRRDSVARSDRRHRRRDLAAGRRRGIRARLERRRCRAGLVGGAVGHVDQHRRQRRYRARTRRGRRPRAARRRDRANAADLQHLYRRVELRARDVGWSSNVLLVGTQQAGSGVSRELQLDGSQVTLKSGTVARWIVSAGGHLLANLDATLRHRRERRVAAAQSVRVGQRDARLVLTATGGATFGYRRRSRRPARADASAAYGCRAWRI
jgi:hypothetical protein